jgi:4-hydroxythreonine-4-phosphate dehydrogenase
VTRADVKRAPGQRIAVSIGCPCGVGPEVSVVAAARAPRESGARVLLVGDVGVVLAAARGRGIAEKRIVRVPSPDQAWGLAPRSIGVWQPGPDLAARDRKPGAPTGISGAAQLAWVDAACDLAATGAADALVTGPVSKEAIARSGAPGAAAFLGHTEHLQRRLRAREVVMAFWSPELATSLATTHIPLARVPREVTPARVARAAYWLAWLLARTGSEPPRIAVASLNPHAGEGGLLGREERTRIVPGIARARVRLRASRIRATLEGPIPAETAFRLATSREARGARGAPARRWSGVVALYHDQATIPMKVAVFGEAVNVSLGLPIVRTSVDHGTAYDRAGTWTADARGMTAAIALAARLAQD